MSGFRSLVPPLSPCAWWVLGARALSEAGTGLTLPFAVVYLHVVRGFSFALAGTVVASIAMVSLAGNPLGGWLADRYGSKAALQGGLLLASIGVAGWAVAATPGEVFVVAVLYGLGLSVAWPAQDALLAVLIGADRRSEVFALGNMIGSIGMTVGALASVLIVDTARPSTFVVLYLLNSGCSLVALAILPRALARPAAPSAVLSPQRAGSLLGSWRSGYATVSKDRVMIGVWLLTALLSTVGFGQMTTALPVLVTEFAGLPAADLGLVYAAETIAAVGLQLVVLRLLAGRRRTRALAALGPVWAGSWALVLVAGLAEDRIAVLVTFIVAMVVFALGETLLWPTLPAIVNDIAPESLRGRYNGAFTLALTTGIVLGPVLSGFALSRGWVVPWLIVLLLACAGSGIAAYLLELVLPRSANLIPVRTTEPWPSTTRDLIATPTQEANP